MVNFPASFRADPIVPHSYIPASSDALEYVRAISESKRRLAFTIACFVLLAVLYSLLATPVFRANALLKIDREGGFFDALLEQQETPRKEFSVAKEEVQVLKSRAVLGAVVDTLDLSMSVKPLYFPVVGEAVARHLHRLNPTFLDDQSQHTDKLSNAMGYAIGDEQIDVGLLDVPEDWLGKEFVLITKKTGYFDLKLDQRRLISNARIGEVTSLRLDEKHAAIVVVNELRARSGARFSLIRKSRLKAIDDLRKSLTVSSEDKTSRMVEVSVKGQDPRQLVAILNALTATYQDLKLKWESSEAEQKLGFVENQLPLVKSGLVGSENALSSFRRQQGAVNLSAESEVTLKRVMAYESKVTGLQKKRLDLTGKYTDDSRKIKVIDEQIASYKAAISRLQGALNSLPEKEKELLSLSRDVKVNTELYLALLNNAQEQRIKKAGSIGSVRIIDNAVPPEKPVWPRPMVLLPLAVCLGLFVGLVKIFVGRAFRTTLEDPSEIEENFGIPVYTSIPHSARQAKLNKHTSPVVTILGKSPQVLATQYPRDPSIESLRSLRTILLNIVKDASNNRVLLCGPRNGMGKSFVSVNLATVLANAGKRVLLVDADLRRGQLHHVLGLGRQPGLTGLAYGDNAMQVIQRSSIEHLHFVASGGVEDTSSEILADPLIKRFFDVFGNKYDHVIIDSPPVLDVADAAMMGRLAGTSLLVVKPGKVSMHEVYHSLKQLHLSGVNVRGCLVNDMTSELNTRLTPYVYSHAYAKRPPNVRIEDHNLAGLLNNQKKPA